MPTPGALISTQLPKLENEAELSLLCVAPTVIALGAPDGERVHASAPSLPAAATTVIPALESFSIALFKAAEVGPPIERFNTALLFEFGFIFVVLSLQDSL